MGSFYYFHSAAEPIIVLASIIAIWVVAETRLHMAVIEVITWTGLSSIALVHDDVFFGVAWFILGLASSAVFLIDWTYHYRSAVAAVAARRSPHGEDAA